MAVSNYLRWKRPLRSSPTVSQKPCYKYKSNYLNFTVSCRERKGIAFPGAKCMHQAWYPDSKTMKEISGNKWDPARASPGMFPVKLVGNGKAKEIHCGAGRWWWIREEEEEEEEAGNIYESRAAIHRYQNWGKEWAKRNSIKFSKDKRDYHFC